MAFQHRKVSTFQVEEAGGMGSSRDESHEMDGVGPMYQWASSVELQRHQVAILVVGMPHSNIVRAPPLLKPCQVTPALGVPCRNILRLRCNVLAENIAS